jgi:hypothetical protein
MGMGEEQRLWQNREMESLISLEEEMQLPIQRKVDALPLSTHVQAKFKVQ